MSFLDNLREYLQEVSRSTDRSAAVAAPLIDAATARNQLIRALERIEQQDRKSTGPTSRRKSALVAEHTLTTWQHDDRIVRFARRMGQLLRQSIGKDASTKDLESWIELALARLFGLPDELDSRIRTLELDRIAKLVEEETFTTAHSGQTIDVSAYATAIRATRDLPRVSLTGVGRVFIELTGRDAVRWLLLVEAAQSTGPDDPWRISRETAQELIQKNSWSWVWVGHLPDPFSSATLSRLGAMGLVRVTDDEEAAETHLEVLPLGRSLLAEIAQGVESPMSVLADSLLSDLTLSAADAAAHPHKRAVDPHVSTAAEATARQARLVAHEIRNVLVPAKTALGALYREVLLEPPSEAVNRRRESIDRGIDAAFRFVDQLVKLSTLTVTPPEPFDPLPTIGEAVAAVEAETGQQVAPLLPATLPPITGHRARVVLAIANVLRNAAQAVSPQGAIIRLQAESIEGARAVLITIEDNGPGVPENMRRAIFDEGVSLRPGGSGMGLALVREIIEKEMRGLVGCDASPLGGARFVLRMPTTGTEPS